MTEAKEVADLARKANQTPQIISTPSGREYLIVPNDNTSTEVTPAHKPAVLMPKSIKQSVTLQNAIALIDYLNRFKSDESLLLADVAQSRIMAAIDYHGAGLPALVDHKATLDLPFSEEWKIWSSINGALKPQQRFV